MTEQEEVTKEPRTERALTTAEKVRALPRDAVRTRAYRLSARMSAILEELWRLDEDVETEAGQADADAAALILLQILRADMTRLHTLHFYHPEVTMGIGIPLDFFDSDGL